MVKGEMLKAEDPPVSHFEREREGTFEWLNREWLEIF